MILNTISFPDGRGSILNKRSLLRSMNNHELITGEGRTKLCLSAYSLGKDLVVLIYNEKAHLGAVAVGEYDRKEKRVSTSVFTRLGHKDDVVAQKAANLLGKHTKKPVCVVAGIHVDNITEAEIKQFLENSNKLVEDFINKWL